MIRLPVFSIPELKKILHPTPTIGGTEVVVGDGDMVTTSTSDGNGDTVTTSTSHAAQVKF